MKWKYLQALIPGWNIIYIIKEKIKWDKKIAQRQRELDEVYHEGRGTLMLVQNYMQQAQESQNEGDLEKAIKYQDLARDTANQFIEENKMELRAGFDLLMRDVSGFGFYMKGLTGGDTFDDFLRYYDIDH